MAFWKPGLSAASTAPSTAIPAITRTDERGHDEVTSFRSRKMPSSHQYKRGSTDSGITQQRHNLPIAKHRRQILYAMDRYKVLVIVGETGSGKSTQIPQYLLENNWSHPPQKSILCTQPRRIAALSLAQRVSTELASPLGAEVGYAVRFDTRCCEETTRIKYVTDGILIREALADPLLSKYSVVMVDEAHERSVNTDLVLGILKKVRRARSDLRIVICSATLDAKAFLDFFTGRTHKRWGNKEGEGVIISVEGRQYPVDILHMTTPVPDYIRATVSTALDIHFGESNGDILCFLPSAEDIDHAIELAEEDMQIRLSSSSNLKKRKQGFLQRVVFLPLHGSLSPHLQMRAIQERNNSSGGGGDHRKIIFATNIAETSVTIPAVKFVVDSGFVKLPFFDARLGLERLVVCPISQASAKQRAGRAGRVSPGKCFRLYPQDSAELSASTPPEIQRTNLTSAVLQLKALEIDRILTFDLMTPPPREAVEHALECLFALGAMDEDCELTPLGYGIRQFPVDPRVGKMMLASLDMGCASEVLKLAAALQVRELFVKPRGEQQRLDFDEATREVVDVSGDHVTFVNVLERDRNKSERECRSVFVNYQAVRRAGEVEGQLHRILKAHGSIRSVRSEGDTERSKIIRKCVTAGFFGSVARLKNDGGYYTLQGTYPISISANSVLSAQSEGSDYIIFGETHDASRGGLEVRCCSAIEGRWLRELAPHYWA